MKMLYAQLYQLNAIRQGKLCIKIAYQLASKLRHTENKYSWTHRKIHQHNNLHANNKTTSSVSFSQRGWLKEVNITHFLGTKGLDPIARRRLWEVLMELKAAGSQSIILTSHVMEVNLMSCHVMEAKDRPMGM